MGPASYAHHLPLPFQGMKVNEEDITHAPKGYTPSGGYDGLGAIKTSMTSLSSV